MKPRLQYLLELTTSCTCTCNICWFFLNIQKELRKTLFRSSDTPNDKLCMVLFWKIVLVFTQWCLLSAASLESQRTGGIETIKRPKSPWPWLNATHPFKSISLFAIDARACIALHIPYTPLKLNSIGMDKDVLITLFMLIRSINSSMYAEYEQTSNELHGANDLN